MHRPSRIFSWFCAAVLCVLLAGCDGASPTEPIFEPPGPSPFAGTWSGTSAQGQAVSFTVAGTTGALFVASLSLSVQMNEPTSGSGGAFCSGQVSTETSQIAVAIVNNRFRLTVPDDFSLPLSGVFGLTRLVFEGTLETEQAASGTLEAEFFSQALQCGARGATTWQAQKG